MVQGIRHVKIAGGIERNAPWIAEAARFRAGTADNFDRLIMRIENLDPAIAEFTDVLIARCVHAHIVWITQLAFACAGLSVRANEFSITRKDLNTMIARISNV
jgi:hypothetical protein